MTVIRRDPDRLFQLLPALHRIADARQGGALRAFLAAITEQADALHDDGMRLLDDYFVETCRPWVLPYVGDLIGNVPLHDLSSAESAGTAESLLLDVVAGPNLRPPGAVGLRTDVARTIRYRRRKGTPLLLEELAREVTGWGARVVEFFTLLTWQQYLEHPRPEAVVCADLRTADVGDRIDGPWDTAPHTVDVRRIDLDQGRYNLPNIGFFLWRLGAYRIIGGTPREVGKPWRRTFSPLGLDTPLFSAGRAIGPDTGPATEFDVEAPIRPAAFAADLTGPPSLYRDPATSDGSLVLTTVTGVVAANLVVCRNLGVWPANQPTDNCYGIDVARGRLVIPVGGADVTVSYHHGFSAPMGGGSYPRRKWIVPRSADAASVTGGGDALKTVLTRAGGPPAVITIADSASYRISASLALAAAQELTIQAADGVRPHLRVDGGALTLTVGDGATLTLGGLLVEGGLVVQGDLDALRLLHTTLVPSPDRPSVAGSIARTQLAYAITGMLHLTGKLWILDSIVDGADGVAIFGPAAHVERSTVFGACRVAALPMASESIFTGDVIADRRGDGCLRFCYLPPGSRTPRQYRCQPGLAVTENPEVSAAETAVRVAPVFTDTRYGRPAYAQLHRACAVELTTGAEDGSEMGVFCVLRQPHRGANLRLRLQEYLPVGREAGLIYIT